MKLFLNSEFYAVRIFHLADDYRKLRRVGLGRAFATGRQDATDHHAGE